MHKTNNKNINKIIRYKYQWNINIIVSSSSSKRQQTQLCAILQQ